MNILESNIKVLQSTDPFLAQRVLEYLRRQSVPVLQQDERGLFNVRIGTQYNEWLYKSDLENERENLQKSIRELPNPQIILWLGLGLGYHAMAYLSHPHPLNRFLLIAEPSMNLFCQFLMIHSIEQWHLKAKITWLIGLEDLKEQLAKRLQDGDFRNSLPNHVMVEWGYSHPEIQQVKNIWQEAVRLDQYHSHSTAIDSFYGLINLSNNFNTLGEIPPLSSFKGVLDGIPGVIVSSGPSLKYSLPLLQEVQERVAIFSVDSSYRLLRQSGIHPQMTGCLERVPYQATLYEGTETDDSFFFSSPLVYPQTFKNFTGPKIFLEQQAFFTSWLFPTSPSMENTSMTSVSHIALYVLWYLGCRPIYLLGQDLAFDPKTQQSHISGLHVDTSRQRMKSYGMDFVTVTSNNETNIETTGLWWLYAQNLEKMVHDLAIDCVNVIPADFGMKLASIPRTDPKDVFSRSFSNKVDVLARLQQKFSQWQLEQQSTHFVSMQAILKSSLAGLSKIMTECTASSMEIYDFFLSQQTSIHKIAGDQIGTYRDFLMKIESRVQVIMAGDLFNNLIYPIVCGSHAVLMKLSYQLMAEDETLEETWFNKISIVLNWLSEIIIQCQMISNRLQ